MLKIIWKRKAVFQKQLEDFDGNETVEVIDMATPQGRLRYKRLLGSKGLKKRNKVMKRRIAASQKRLFEFIEPAAKYWAKDVNASPRMPYHSRIHPPLPEEFMEGRLPESQILSFQHSPGFRGYLRDLFVLNDFSAIERALENRKKPAGTGPYYQIDVFKLELGRYKLGFTNHGLWLQFVQNTEGLLESFQLYKEELPDTGQYSKLLGSIKSLDVMDFFYGLRKQCTGCGLIDFKLGIWDGHFVRSNCSNNRNKGTGEYSDPDAGFYKHGWQSKGRGYLDSCIIDGKKSLPVYFKIFPANDNDNPVYRDTFASYLDRGDPAFWIMLVDAGPYSEESLDLTAYSGTVPVIFARKNIKEGVTRVAKYKYINVVRIPPYILSRIKEYMDLRTRIERFLAGPEVVFKANQMSNRGKENAEKNTGFYRSLELMTAQAAFRAGRADLISAPSAFRDIPCKDLMYLYRAPEDPVRRCCAAPEQYLREYLLEWKGMTSLA